MRSHIALSAAAVGLVATPVFAAGKDPSASNHPGRLSDGELDQVVAGDAQLVINVVLPAGVRFDPSRIVIDPPPGTAIVQANVGGSATLSASGPVGTQNLFYLPTPPRPSG